MKFSATNFPKIFRGIIPEKYRYFPEISGKIPQEISGNFRTHNTIIKVKGDHVEFRLD